MRLPWFVKYRPKSLSEVENQEEAKSQLKEWITSWLHGKPGKKSVLLYGPPGVGKTTLAEALARDFDLELFELNASDSRRLQEIERTAKVASTSSTLFGKKGKLLLLDEVDGMDSKEDRGGFQALLQLVDSTDNPVLLTANDPWDPSMRELRARCQLIELKKLGKVSSRRVLKRICEMEKVRCDEDALNEIIEESEGDLRYAINALQAVAEGRGSVTRQSVEATIRKERELDPFETLRSVFWARYAWQARNAVSSSRVDYEMLLRWFDENLPLQFEDFKDLSRAYAALSRASLFSSRARYVSWDLLSYVFDIMGIGLAFAEAGKSKPGWKAKWRKYQFPQYISSMARTKSSREVRDSLLSKIASKTHCSMSKVKNDVLSTLRLKPSKEVADYFGLTEDELKYLKTLWSL